MQRRCSVSEAHTLNTKRTSLCLKQTCWVHQHLTRSTAQHRIVRRSAVCGAAQMVWPTSIPHPCCKASLSRTPKPTPTSQVSKSPTNPDPLFRTPQFSFIPVTSLLSINSSSSSSHSCNSSSHSCNSSNSIIWGAKISHSCR